MDDKIEINTKIEKVKKPFVSEDNKDIIDSWYKRAREVTPETFGDLINELLHDYNLDYSAKVHAAAACTIAMFNACYDIFGFSGFQSSASIMQVLYKLNYPGNKTGIRVIDYYEMLYPPDPSVLHHWMNISFGDVPFEYYISD